MKNGYGGLWYQNQGVGGAIDESLAQLIHIPPLSPGQSLGSPNEDRQVRSVRQNAGW